MKRTFKKLIAIMLVAVLAAAFVPAVVSAAEDISSAIDTPVPGKFGYIPSEMHGARAVSSAYERGDMETYYSLTGRNRDTLPSSYDSRNYNYVTSVKNQGSYGSCWAHAAMACVESYMIKHGVPVGNGSAATTSLNLSETHHCFFSYTSAYDAEGMLTGDKTNMTASDGKNGLDVGGNGEMSAYTLMRWTGAASESVSALAYSAASTVASSGLNSQYAYQNNVCHVQNSVWVPASDIEGVKRAIMEYGAGNISYCASPNSYSTYTNTYQCVTDSSKSPNHAITVVGWDDSISKSNFRPDTPSSNGGWLCKNSWGTSQFNAGYMYISYEDASVLASGYIFFYDAEAIDNYDHNYQYDGTINMACYGKGYNSSTEWYEGFANNTKVANVFTASGSEMLRAISFCNWDEALTYTVEIYKNPTTGNPSSGTLMSSQTGYLTYSGYYTIPLDTPVMLSQGETFAVVITQSCPTADDNGKYIHTPYDATFNNSNWADWLNFVHVNHGNTSYYQEPNGAWTDCPDNGDYRIKAYTDDYENTYTVNAVSNNTSYGTVSVTGTVITCTPAAGYYVESCTVTAGTATYTINGNTVTVSPESDCTIRVNFAPKPQYTVNYIASGAAEGSATAYLDDAITLPATVSVNPDGWTFAGWVTAQVEETADEPNFYAPGASYTVTGNATLYALYSRVDGSGGTETVYQLVTSAPSSWAGNYVITNNPTSITNMNSAYVLKGVTGSSSGTNAESASNCTVFSSTGITQDGEMLKNVPSDYVMTVAASGSYYSIKAPNNTYYGMNSSSYLYSYSSYNSSYCAWTPSINTSGVAQLKNSRNGSYPYFGWSTSNNYFWSASTNNANVLRLWKETQITTSTTYYCTDPVVAQPTYYTVTFVDWDGTEIETQQVLEGAAATAPADPVREGYTFTGWDVDFSNVTSDLTVTAQYTVTTYTVTFKDWDGTTLGTDEVEYGGTAVAPVTPTREGYTFTGWSSSLENITANKTVYAMYDILTFTVTFKDWDGTVLKTQTVNYGGSATAPADPEREGYTFTGWDVAFTNIKADTVVTAQYTIRTFTVTFVDYDGTVLKTETVDYGAAATAPADPEREGYVFTGWDVDFSNVTENLTVTAQYIEEGLEPTLLGDVNCDGKVDSTDALLAMRASMGLATISAQGLVNGDMNGDGNVNATDAVLIMRVAMGSKFMPLD